MNQTIAKDLHGDATGVFWIGSAYLVPCAAFQPIMASFSGIYGRSVMLAIALSFFVLGSIVGCAARNMATILAGRVIQGVGGGGLIPLSIMLLTDIVPLHKRAKFAAMIQLGIALGTILGPLVGGCFAEYTSQSGGWRWVFYINFPLSAIAGVMLCMCLQFKYVGAQLRSIDWFGQIIFVAGLSSLLIGLSWGGVQFSWSSYHTLVPLCLGVVGIVVTGLWEYFGATHPFLHLAVLKNRSLMAIYAATIVQGITVRHSIRRNGHYLTNLHRCMGNCTTFHCIYRAPS